MAPWQKHLQRGNIITESKSFLQAVFIYINKNTLKNFLQLSDSLTNSRNSSGLMHDYDFSLELLCKFSEYVYETLKHYHKELQSIDSVTGLSVCNSTDLLNK